MLKDYVKVNLNGGSGYIQPRESLMDVLDGELDGIEVGEPVTLTFELVKMEESEYLALPEFAGH